MRTREWMTRRRFLSALAIALAVIAAPWSAAVAGEPAAKPAFNDVTFFVVSDTHYGAKPDPKEVKADVKTDDKNAIKHEAIDRMNALPGQPYPKQVGGGTVSVPRGVIVPGDLINDGTLPVRDQQWADWLADFKVKGDGRVRWPAYEGIGNHDLSPTMLVQNAIRQRNRERPAVTNISSNGLHYSWDWDRLHMVMLNLYPGDKPDPATHYSPIHNPEGALQFLKDDLAKNVGTSGRPVILCHHYDLQGTDWWTETERAAYYEAFKDYNVIGIIHGHTGTGIYKWRGIDVFNVGQLGPTVFVFHVTPTELTAAQRKSDGTWGFTLRKPITGLKAAPP